MISPIPTVWGILRNSALPIVDVIGKGTDIRLEINMINVALDILKKAEKFSGKPYIKDQMFIPKATIIVSFSIEFPSDAELIQFIEFMKNTTTSNP